MDKQNNRNLLKQAILDGIAQRYEEELSATQEFLIYSRRLERERRRRARVKRIFVLLIAAVLASAAFISAIAYANGRVRGTVVRVTEDGWAELDIIPQKLFEELEIGDTAIVKIGSFRVEMPFAEEPISEEGKCQLLLDGEAWRIFVCGYREDVCEKYGIRVGDRVLIRKSGN